MFNCKLVTQDLSRVKYWKRNDRSSMVPQYLRTFSRHKVHVKQSHSPPISICNSSKNRRVVLVIAPRLYIKRSRSTRRRSTSADVTLEDRFADGPASFTRLSRDVFHSFANISRGRSCAKKGDSIPRLDYHGNFSQG